MSDATGDDDATPDDTPDETFGHFEDDPVLGQQFVPRGDPPEDGGDIDNDPPPVE